MPRVDRVMDLLEHLRASDTSTVAQLARRMGVSRRTVLRDLATLRDRGEPLHTEAGPGGGVRLDRDRGVVAVHLRTDELVALWMTAQLSSTLGVLPWSKSARSALDKAFASVPPARARVLRRVLQRILIGRPAGPRVRQDLGAAAPEILVAFERAFGGDVCLSFDYTDREGRASRRCVEPHGLLVEAPALYLLARDTESGQARMFRMDRIRAARVLPDRPFRPDFEGLREQVKAQWARERAARAAP